MTQNSKRKDSEMAAKEFYDAFKNLMLEKGFRQLYSGVYGKDVSEDFLITIRMMAMSHKVRGYIYADFVGGVIHVPTQKLYAEILYEKDKKLKRAFLLSRSWETDFYNLVPKTLWKDIVINYYEGCDLEQQFKSFWRNAEQYVIPKLRAMSSLEKILEDLDDGFTREIEKPIIYYELHRYQEGIDYVNSRFASGGYSSYEGEAENAEKIRSLLQKASNTGVGYDEGIEGSI